MYEASSREGAVRVGVSDASKQVGLLAVIVNVVSCVLREEPVMTNEAVTLT